MFKLHFNYYGKDIALLDCYGLTFSPHGRKMYVKVKINGRIVTQSYFTKSVNAFMLSFY